MTSQKILEKYGTVVAETENVKIYNSNTDKNSNVVISYFVSENQPSPTEFIRCMEKWFYYIIDNKKVSKGTASDTSDEKSINTYFKLLKRKIERSTGKYSKENVIYYIKDGWIYYHSKDVEYTPEEKPIEEKHHIRRRRSLSMYSAVGKVISLSDVRNALSYGNKTITMNDQSVRNYGGKPTGTITLDDLRGQNSGLCTFTPVHVVSNPNVSQNWNGFVTDPKFGGNVSGSFKGWKFSSIQSQYMKSEWEGLWIAFTDESRKIKMSDAYKERMPGVSGIHVECNGVKAWLPYIECQDILSTVPGQKAPAGDTIINPSVSFGITRGWSGLANVIQNQNPAPLRGLHNAIMGRIGKKTNIKISM